MSSHYITIIGFIASMLTTAAFIPQVWKVLKTRATRDLSLPMYLAFVIGVACWLAYGILTHDTPVTVANAITLVLSGSVLVMKLRLG